MSVINLEYETTYLNETVEKDESQVFLASERLDKALTLICENVDSLQKKRSSASNFDHKDVILANLDALISQVQDVLEKKQ